MWNSESQKKEKSLRHEKLGKKRKLESNKKAESDTDNRLKDYNNEQVTMIVLGGKLIRYDNLTKSFSKLQSIQNLIKGKKSQSVKKERMTKQKTAF